MKRTDHVRIENTTDGNQRMFCERCGVRMVIELPLPFDMWRVIARQFEKEHRHCKPVVAPTEEQ